MNRLSSGRRTQIISALLEGNSIRATCRMTSAAKATVLKLLVDLGRACEAYQSGHLRNLSCKRVQCDEVWSFVVAKQTNVTDEQRGRSGRGDVWTWTATCADEKLVPCWMVGSRDAGAAHDFMKDVGERLNGRVQLTTDGQKVYVDAVESALQSEVDYAMLVKLYGAEPQNETHCSPAEGLGCQDQTIMGKRYPAHISTSNAEYADLTTRMEARRFTRLTDAFSKRVENHAAAVALHFMWHNFGRIHRSLRVTPAMAAGVTTRLWTAADIVALLDTN